MTDGQIGGIVYFTVSLATRGTTLWPYRRLLLVKVRRRTSEEKLLGRSHLPNLPELHLIKIYNVLKAIITLRSGNVEMASNHISLSRDVLKAATRQVLSLFLYEAVTTNGDKLLVCGLVQMLVRNLLLR